MFTTRPIDLRHEGNVRFQGSVTELRDQPPIQNVRNLKFSISRSLTIACANYIISLRVTGVLGWIALQWVDSFMNRLIVLVQENFRWVACIIPKINSDVGTVTKFIHLNLDGYRKYDFDYLLLSVLWSSTKFYSMVKWQRLYEAIVGTEHKGLANSGRARSQRERRMRIEPRNHQIFNIIIWGYTELFQPRSHYRAWQNFLTPCTGY